MTDTNVITTLRPHEVGERLLNFLENLRGAEGLAPAALERAFEMPVTSAPEQPLRYGVHGRIDANWNFGLRTVVDDGDRRVRSAAFYFNRPADNDGDMDAVCEPDFEAYRARLSAMGYAAEPVYAEHGRLLHWRFDRGAVRLLAQVRAQNAARPARDCLAGLSIET